MQGGGRDDVITGGSDYIEGGGGNDRLDGGVGLDHITGGSDGSASATYEGLTDIVYVDRSGMTANASGDANGDTLSTIANLIGSSHNDMPISEASNNVIDGGLGNDHIFGDNGDGSIIGGSGADRATGATGADTSVFQHFGDLSGGSHGTTSASVVIAKLGHAEFSTSPASAAPVRGTRSIFRGSRGFAVETSSAFNLSDGGPQINVTVNGHGVPIITETPTVTGSRTSPSRCARTDPCRKASSS